MLFTKKADANRANSLLSTGPTSLEGKDRVRRNALKFGLSSRSLILPENEARLAERRKTSFAASFHLDAPDGFSGVLLTQIAVESVRMERCQQEELLLREQASEEAAVLWHNQRRIAACELGKTIHDDPEIIRLKLESTFHGAEWLKGRWLILNMALETQNTWNAVETDLAHDLSGTPAILRESLSLGSLDDRKALVAKELDRLKQTSLERMPLDWKSQDLAEVGVSTDLDKRLKTLRRYESASRRAFDKSLAELRRHIGAAHVKVKEVNGLAQESQPETILDEAKPSSVGSTRDWEAEFEAELAALAAKQEIRIDPAPIAPSSIRISDRPASHLNRKQRRKLASARRSA